MRITKQFLFFCIAVPILIFEAVHCTSDVPVVPRAEWGARAPVQVDKMENPVPFVVIHHSYLPPACYNSSDCTGAMKWMQDLHQINNSWNDIGYSFAIGGDGRIYEGRGWSKVGAHAPKYNQRSIGICLIGDWREQLPPENMLALAQKLIDTGVRQGFIIENYQLVGHKTVRKGTDCPGNRLMQEIGTWKGFTNDPRTYVPDEVRKIQDNNDVDAGVNKNKLRKRTISR